MKSFYLRFFFVSSLTLLAVSCGGSKSGGGKSIPAAINPLAYNLNTTSAESLANVTAWYNSVAEGNFGTPGLGTVGTQEERTVKVYAAHNGCVSKPIKIFGRQVATFQSCNTSDAVDSQNIVRTPFVATANGASKASVTRVASIFNGSLGSITNVVSAPSPTGSGFIYTITVSPDVNNPAVSKLFVIDTGVNSALNPVYSMDSATRTEESLNRIL